MSRIYCISFIQHDLFITCKQAYIIRFMDRSSMFTDMFIILIDWNETFIKCFINRRIQ